MKINDMFSSIKNSFGETVGYIDLFDEIGESWGQNGAKDFIEQYRELEKTCSKIVININSPGGSVFTGQQIASYIKSSKVYSECHIGALCASIATVIACACDKVIMPSNSIWLSHSPISGQGGNAHDLRKMADFLDKIEETILNIYEDKCGGKKTRDELRAITTGEDNDGQGTWLDAYECLEIGFIDEVSHSLAIAAKYTGPSNVIINGTNIDLTNFKNTTKLKELIENKSNNKLEETNMSEISKTGISAMIDNIANSIKSSLGIKNEVEQVVEPETVEQTEEVVAQEENLEVQDEPIQEVPEVVEPVAEETEAQEEIVEPSAEVEEEIEPSTETEPVAIVEPEAEIIAEVEEQPAQEEPETEVAPEVTETVQDEPEITDEPEQDEEEIEPSPEASVSVPEVNASIDLAQELAKVKDELNKIKEADAQKAIALAKAELAKEVGNKFRGVPGKLEDKVELVYELKNSALSDSSKEMIFKSLENLSAQNLEACEELGHSEEVIVDESDKMSQAKALAQKEGISEGQAILVLDGTKTLKQVKNKK